MRKMKEKIVKEVYNNNKIKVFKTNTLMWNMKD